MNTNDFILAGKLTGSGGGGGGSNTPAIVNDIYNGEFSVLDKTFSQIKELFLSGTPVIIVSQNIFDDPDYGTTTTEQHLVTGLKEVLATGSQTEISTYEVSTREHSYTANNPNDYPFY